MKDVKEEKTKMRESTRIKIPEEYLENERKGLCKVCGKEKKDFDKHMIKYCSDICRSKFNDCFTTWQQHKTKILTARGNKCEQCGFGGQIMQVDHIVAIVNGGDMWEDSNLQLLCMPCHVVKTRKDIRLSKIKECPRCGIVKEKFRKGICLECFKIARRRLR